jgi:Tfp pilus assembly protein PilF
MKNRISKAMSIRRILTILAILFIASSFSKAQEYNKNLEIAYNYLNNGRTNDAILIFEDHIKQYPGDMQINLQLAYAYKKIGNVDKATDRFKYVTLNSTNKKDILLANNELSSLEKGNQTVSPLENLNKAYTYLDQGEYNKAVDIFENYKLEHPEDTKVYLQLGYLYDKLGMYKKSLDCFDYVYSNSKNSDEVDKAARSRYYMNDLIIKNSYQSLSIYFYNVYDSYFKNYISSLVGHVNFSLFKNANTGFYADVNMDSRSKTGTIYNDRYYEGGGFFNYMFSDNLGFELRAGYAREVDFNKNIFNFKPILFAGTRIGNPAVYLGSEKSKSNNFYLDVFSMGLYDYKFRNLFGLLLSKEVYRAMTGGYSYFEFYLTQLILADSRRLDYNNYGEIGIGVNFKPDLAKFPVIFLEATNKTFLIGPGGQFLQGTLRNTFQIKAGFLLNFNTKL